MRISQLVRKQASTPEEQAAAKKARLEANKLSTDISKTSSYLHQALKSAKENADKFDQFRSQIWNLLPPEAQKKMQTEQVMLQKFSEHMLPDLIRYFANFQYGIMQSIIIDQLNPIVYNKR